MSKAPVRLLDLFRYYKGLPHQMAAISELEAAMPPSLLRRENAWFSTWSQAGKQADGGWVLPARKIVQEYEGCRLVAYRCPAGVPTIGWGATTIGGQAVKDGQRITQAQADEQLSRDLERFHAALVNAIPAMAGWPANRQAALVSWCFNVGVGAMQDSTLRRRILAGENPELVVVEELPKWNKGDGGKILAGLVRRREAEVALFLGKPEGYGNPLSVPWYGQRDSATDQARRMCFSSSCAMLLAALRPGVLQGPNGDDQYLARVRQFGDTTSPVAQVQALGSYEIRAEFTKQADWRTIEGLIDRGIPVPLGYLHRGPVTAPAGGGHWLCCVGYTAESLIVHDPWGEADLITGQTAHPTARFAYYSRKNFGPRWMVDGPGSGWAIVADR